MKKTSCISAFLVFLFFTANVGAAPAPAVTITTFGSVDEPTYTVLNNFTDFTVNQSSSSITISGTDSDTLSGDVPLVDLSSVFGQYISVNGWVATDPGTKFKIVLFDNSFNKAFYAGGSWTNLSEVGETLLTLSSQEARFDSSQVLGFDFSAAGTGGNALEATLTGASMVPEPSTYAALAGLLALGYVVVRRRKA